MTITYAPKGTCSSRMTIEVEDTVIKTLRIDGGCAGNLQGISRLAVGMTVDQVIAKLEGIHCGAKATSCPDQLAKALREAKV